MYAIFRIALHGRSNVLQAEQGNSFTLAYVVGGGAYEIISFRFRCKTELNLT